MLGRLREGSRLYECEKEGKEYERNVWHFKILSVTDTTYRIAKVKCHSDVTRQEMCQEFSLR